MMLRLTFAGWGVVSTESGSEGECEPTVLWFDSVHVHHHRQADHLGRAVKAAEEARRARLRQCLPAKQARLPENRTVSWQRSTPRSARRSSTLRSDSGYFTHVITARRITSGELLEQQNGLGGTRLRAMRPA
jgi:hypothetical protein